MAPSVSMKKVMPTNHSTNCIVGRMVAISPWTNNGVFRGVFFYAIATQFNCAVYRHSKALHTCHDLFRVFRLFCFNLRQIEPGRIVLRRNCPDENNSAPNEFFRLLAVLVRIGVKSVMVQNLFNHQWFRRRVHELGKATLRPGLLLTL